METPCDDRGRWWGGQIRRNSDGEYTFLQQEIHENFVLPFPKAEKIRSNLKLVYGIGEKTEAQLRIDGYDTIDKLAVHPRWGRAAREIIRLIDSGNFERLRRYGAKEDEIVGFFDRSQIVLLDLETTGFSQVQPLFLIGVLAFTGQNMVLSQYLAKTYEEEAAALRAFLEECGKKTLMVSFNGRTFDYPYLKARCLYHKIKIQFDPFQLDLLPPTRRAYRNLLPNYRLRTVEELLLGVGRNESFSGSAIPELYHRFVIEKEPRLLTEVIAHNAQDLLSMAALIQLLSVGWQDERRDARCQ
jgi:uncharacterized protein YprB with RNaseH-like and TPR domain